LYRYSISYHILLRPVVYTVHHTLSHKPRKRTIISINTHFSVRTTHEDFQSSTKIISQGNYIFFFGEINFTVCTTLIQ